MTNEGETLAQVASQRDEALRGWRKERRQHIDARDERDVFRAALERIAELQHNPTMADTRPAAYRIAREALSSAGGTDDR